MSRPDFTSKLQEAGNSFRFQWANKWVHVLTLGVYPAGIPRYNCVCWNSGEKSSWPQRRDLPHNDYDRHCFIFSSHSLKESNQIYVEGIPWLNYRSMLEML